MKYDFIRKHGEFYEVPAQDILNDFIKQQKLIDHMQSGNVDSIIEGLNHKGALLRINAIMNFARHRIKDSELIQMVESLQDDNNSVNGFLVSDFASAALDLVGYKPYCGSNENVIKLINSKFEF